MQLISYGSRNLLSQSVNLLLASLVVVHCVVVHCVVVLIVIVAVLIIVVVVVVIILKNYLNVLKIFNHKNSFVGGSNDNERCGVDVVVDESRYSKKNLPHKATLSLVWEARILECVKT